MMSPIQIRRRSLRAFKFMLICGALGLVLLIGTPNPGFHGTSNPIAANLAIGSLLLLVLSLISCLVSLANGIIAWKKGAGFCPWIVICGLFLLSAIALFTLSP